MISPETPGRRALHLAVLAAIAAAPVLLVVDAQFFIGRGAGAFEVAAVALTLLVALPLAVALVGLLLSLASKRLGWIAHLALVGAIGALIFSEALYPLGLRVEIQAPLALAAGVAAALAYRSREGFRSAISSLAPLPPLILAFVFLLTPVSGLVFGGEPEVEAPDVRGDTPVVLIVFDELPGHALMDAGGRIDAKRYPAFAALAENATWFPNATSPRSDTELAVPTVATGKNAAMDSLGTATDHPESVFTLLGESHEMHVSEPWTNLCPDELCEGSTKSVDEAGLGSLLATIPEVWGYVAIPDAQRIGIPSPRESGAKSRPGQVRTFASEIEPTSEPVLHFLHVLLPHKAWRYLPSGERYSDTVGADSELGGLGEWSDDEWLTLQHEQRFLLQLGYTDALLGEVLEALKDADLYDRSLVIVTADHGVSFRAGDERRDATESNAADILSVPLFVKAPGQAKALVDGSFARTTDVVPTIAAGVGAESSWSFDGQSLLGSAVTRRPITIENLREGGVTLTPGEYADALDAALARRIDAFGDGAQSLYEIGPETDLLGRPVDPLVGEPADGEASVIDGKPIASYDPGEDLLPARIAGAVSGVEPGEPLALSLNGRIAATTYAYEGSHSTEYAAMIPPELIGSGDNELGVYSVEGTGTAARLRPLEVSF